MTLPKKSEIFLHWKPYLDQQGLGYDEPHCWACGYGWKRKSAPTNQSFSDDELANIYDREKHLQRCHIIPRSLGGSDDVSNLFLMCSECHDLAPNTSSSDSFFKWVEKQSWFSRRYSELLDGMKPFDISEKDSKEIKKILQSDDFHQWWSKNGSLHHNQSGNDVATTASPLYATISAFQEMKKHESQN
jgi:hypothetical protein